VGAPNLPAFNRGGGEGIDRKYPAKYTQMYLNRAEKLILKGFLSETRGVTGSPSLSASPEQNCERRQ
jgi:hypothetical protein